MHKLRIFILIQLCFYFVVQPPTLLMADDRVSGPSSYTDGPILTTTGVTLTVLAGATTGTAVGGIAYTIAIAIPVAPEVATNLATGVGAGASAAAVIIYFAHNTARNRDAMLKSMHEDAAAYIATDGEQKTPLLESLVKTIEKKYAEIRDLPPLSETEAVYAIANAKIHHM